MAMPHTPRLLRRLFTDSLQEVLRFTREEGGSGWNQRWTFLTSLSVSSNVYTTMIFCLNWVQLGWSFYVEVIPLWKVPDVPHQRYLRTRDEMATCLRSNKMETWSLQRLKNNNNNGWHMSKSPAWKVHKPMCNSDFWAMDWWTSLLWAHVCMQPRESWNLHILTPLGQGSPSTASPTLNICIQEQLPCGSGNLFRFSCQREDTKLSPSPKFVNTTTGPVRLYAEFPPLS